MWADADISDWLEGAKTQLEWLTAADVAATAASPPRVNFQQVTIMPTGQPN
ncbi:hypothetical protein ACFTSF_38840 [Kribbella sp. NPDC056951]|uniref:hypothetical protein n=1 Tax=Kribbella sp. NPDC056951 TaxID=3345978 RepID=UPI0036315063